MIRSVPVVSGGLQAARLRSLRRAAGPVPPWYPDTRPVQGAIRSVGPRAWRAAGLITRFGELLMTSGRGASPWPGVPAVERTATRLGGPLPAAAQC